MLKRIFSAYFQLAIRVFYRRVEVDGRERAQGGGPLILAPNHLNAFVDPLAIQGVLPRELTITAKNTLADKRLYGFLMRIGGVVTFHRRQDWGKGAEMAANADAVAECKTRLARNEALCIFPEGVSHSDSAMRPFKYGAARIAIEYAAGEASLQILPVGLIYEAKERFRSRLWIRFGEPIRMADRAYVNRRELTAEIESRVRALTVNFPSERDAILADWAARVLLAVRRNVRSLDAREASLSDRVRIVQELQESLPVRRDVVRRVRAHRAALRRLRLTPEDVFLQPRRSEAARFILAELILAAAGLPLALWGFLNNLIPYLVIRRVTVKLATMRDLWSSTAVYASVIVFPLIYALQTALVCTISFSLAVLYALSLPLTGYLCLIYGERLARSWHRWGAWRRFLQRPHWVSETRALAEELNALLERVKTP